MRNIRDFLGLVRLFLKLVFSMLHNYQYLNDDLENNFLVCKRICKKIVRTAHIKLRMYGKENIPDSRPFLLVPNHRCFFDVVFMLAELDRPVSFVAAKELWAYPILRTYLSAIYCIPLDRYTTDLAKLKGNITQIQTALSKHNLVMFPEGECSYEKEEMNDFKKGGFMGVIGMDVDLVPAYIKIGEFRNLGKKWMIPRGSVSIYIGDPSHVSSISDKRVQAAQLAQFAQRQVEALRDANK